MRLRTTCWPSPFRSTRRSQKQRCARDGGGGSALGGASPATLSSDSEVSGRIVCPVPKASGQAGLAALGLSAGHKTTALGLTGASPQVVRDPRTKKSKGYGFVSFLDGNDFAKALREMNGKYIGNRPCKLSKSSWDERTVRKVTLREPQGGNASKKQKR